MPGTIPGSAVIFTWLPGAAFAKTTFAYLAFLRNSSVYFLYTCKSKFSTIKCTLSCAVFVSLLLKRGFTVAVLLISSLVTLAASAVPPPNMPSTNTNTASKTEKYFCIDKASPLPLTRLFLTRFVATVTSPPEISLRFILKTKRRPCQGFMFSLLFQYGYLALFTR